MSRFRRLHSASLPRDLSKSSQSSGFLCLYLGRVMRGARYRTESCSDISHHIASKCVCVRSHFGSSSTSVGLESVAILVQDTHATYTDTHTTHSLAGLPGHPREGRETTVSAGACEGSVTWPKLTVCCLHGVRRGDSCGKEG